MLTSEMLTIPVVDNNFGEDIISYEIYQYNRNI
jgi:hypothetical protein